MKIIGIQRNVKFKYDGQVFEGTNVYTSEEKQGVEGIVAQKFFFNRVKDCHKVVEGLKVGDNIMIGYNRFGKPESVQKI